MNSGGLVDVASNLRIRNLGDVNLDGGELRVGGDVLFTDAGSTFDFTAGTLRFTGTGSRTFSSLLLEWLLGPDPTLEAGRHLAVDGSTVFGGPLRVNGGELGVGNMTPASFADVDFDAGTLDLTALGISVDNTGLFGSALIIDDDEAVTTSQSLIVQNGGLLDVARGPIAAANALNLGTVVVAQGSADFDSGLPNRRDVVLIDATAAGGITNDGGTITLIGTNHLGSGVFDQAASGTLGVTLGPTIALSTLGPASLAGGLNLGLDDNAFDPAAYATQELVAAGGGLLGTFDTVDGVLLGDGTGLAVRYTATTAQVTRALVENATLDGDVDVFEFTGGGDAQVLTSNLGTGSGGTWSQGDFSGNGDVDVFEFMGTGDAQLLTSNLSATFGGGVLAAASSPAAGVA